MRTNNRFQKGSGVYTCRICKHQTRHTGGDGAGVGACDLCYEMAGEENHISDSADGKTYGTPEGVRAELAALDARNKAGGGKTALECFPEVCAAVGYMQPTKTPEPAPVAPAKPLILNPAQARAVYEAMCALNNVGAKIKASFGNVADNGINVFEEPNGSVNVVRVHQYDVTESERYGTQAQFHGAYDL